MREQPTGESLLQCARDVLKNKVIGLLQGDAKLDVLMVMNAMGIAQRELQMGLELDQVEQKSLTKLLGTPVSDPGHAERDLVLRIRNGFADPGSAGREIVLDHLRNATTSRLQISNPKVLREK